MLDTRKTGAQNAEGSELAATMYVLSLSRSCMDAAVVGPKHLRMNVDIVVLEEVNNRVGGVRMSVADNLRAITFPSVVTQGANDEGQEVEHGKIHLPYTATWRLTCVLSCWQTMSWSASESVALRPLLLDPAAQPCAACRSPRASFFKSKQCRLADGHP